MPHLLADPRKRAGHSRYPPAGGVSQHEGQHCLRVETMTDDARTESGWHLDKKVPIALIVAIITQSIAFGWWGAKLDARQEYLETRLIRAEANIERDAQASRNVSDRLIRVEEGVKAILDVVRRTEDRRSSPN
jgi:hypothetical protein